MIRRCAMLMSFIAAIAVPISAQTQSHPQHPPGKPHHPPDHPPLDPAVHAAMHAKLLGNWTGMLTSVGSDPRQVQLAITHDQHGKMTVSMKHGDAGISDPIGTDVTIDQHGLHWSQALAGVACKATAGLETGTHHGPETMKGTMACTHGDVAFSLHKVKG